MDLVIPERPDPTGLVGRKVILVDQSHDLAAQAEKEELRASLGIGPFVVSGITFSDDSGVIGQRMFLLVKWGDGEIRLPRSFASVVVESDGSGV